MKIFTVNPGSTSTKIALFEEETCIFSKVINHDAAILSQFANISDQKPYRLKSINQALAEANISLDDVDAFVGRGAGLLPLEGGTYEVNDILLYHATIGADGVNHTARLGTLIACEFAQKNNKRAFVVNPPDVDELQDLARMTGIAGVYRNVHLHALNLKETAIRHAASMGRRYEDCNFVVCHIGGGVSVSAHRGGRMVDGFDIVGGEGPMAPTRCGSVPLSSLLEYMKTHDLKEVELLLSKTGGFVSHLGNADAVELEKQAAAGDKKAKMVWDVMIYQIAKCIGAMASVLQGKVDGILLGGGIVHSSNLVDQLRNYCGWIAPLTAYPGEFEMEAMAFGALRVLRGTEKAKTYTGKSVWTGFDFDNE